MWGKEQPEASGRVQTEPGLQTEMARGVALQTKRPWAGQETKQPRDLVAKMFGLYGIRESGEQEGRLKGWEDLG